jgi:Tfp pilus assembly protein PilX
MNRDDDRHDDRDKGAVLPLVLVMTVVIAAVVIGLANWAVSSLAFGRVTEDRSDRLSAADAGMRYAIDQLKLRNAGCILDTQEAVLPGVQADFNDATAAVTCERITSGFEGIAAYAAVMTGAGIPSGQALLTSQSGSNEKILGGPVYMSRVGANSFALSPPVNIKDGPLLYHDTSGTTPCTSVKASALPSKLVFEPKLIFGPVCVSVPWTEIFKSPMVPDLTSLPELNGSVPSSNPMGSYIDDANGCRVFKPGRYTTPPAVDGVDAYFQSGDYLFDFVATSDNTFSLKQSTVTAGRVNPVTTKTLVNEIPNPKCGAAQGADPAQFLPDPADQFGATFYFARSSRINVNTQGSLEIHARQQGIADYVSVQALCGARDPRLDDGGRHERLHSLVHRFGRPRG